MTKHTFSCIDGHTCGNPVRVVTQGGPELEGKTMLEQRAHFIAEYDWIRTGLMFEPRGHDIMSGTILYPTTRDDCDIAFLYIETTGCLPMCGHGTIGTVTFILEHNLVQPKTEGIINIDTPAGKVTANYTKKGDKITSVRLTNIPSFLHESNLSIYCPDLGEIKVDVAYGGNFYAIIDPQENFKDIADHTALDLIRWSPLLRQALNDKYQFIHPEKPDICGLSHVLWTGAPRHKEATARNAVFYGEKAIDRSPCGTGTSSRMAQWASQGKLKKGDKFVHESIIGSLFHGQVEDIVKVGDKQAIIPSFAGWAVITGLNTIFIDAEEDPFAYGFTVK